jgi:hypothetical protein
VFHGEREEAGDRADDQRDDPLLDVRRVPAGASKASRAPREEKTASRLSGEFSAVKDFRRFSCAFRAMLAGERSFRVGCSETRSRAVHLGSSGTAYRVVTICYR